MSREHIPIPVQRAVLVEAGHRCAIPTCRSTTTEIAHIVPWAETQDNSFENLIALCPNCHTRFDLKKDIDRLSVRKYKQNLGILNNRYGECERRLFAILGESKERYFVLGPGGDILVANAVQDGLFLDKQVKGMNFHVRSTTGFSKEFPMTFTYWVTDAGMEFINHYLKGSDLN